MNITAITLIFNFVFIIMVGLVMLKHLGKSKRSKQIDSDVKREDKSFDFTKFGTIDFEADLKPLLILISTFTKEHSAIHVRFAGENSELGYNDKNSIIIPDMAKTGELIDDCYKGIVEKIGELYFTKLSFYMSPQGIKEIMLYYIRDVYTTQIELFKEQKKEMIEEDELVKSRIKEVTSDIKNKMKGAIPKELQSIADKYGLDAQGMADMYTNSNYNSAMATKYDKTKHKTERDLDYIKIQEYYHKENKINK
ncbi:MAG: hypothetical protein ACRC92_04100 [Peptostreptococcaceae bacterium]